MSHYLNKILKTQRFQDIAGIIRGLDRVKLGLFQDINNKNSNIFDKLNEGDLVFPNESILKNHEEINPVISYDTHDIIKKPSDANKDVLPKQFEQVNTQPSVKLAEQTVSNTNMSASLGANSGVSSGLGTGVSSGLGTGVSSGLGTGVSTGLGTGVSSGLGVGVSTGFNGGVSSTDPTQQHQKQYSESKLAMDTFNSSTANNTTSTTTNNSSSSSTNTSITSSTSFANHGPNVDPTTFPDNDPTDKTTNFDEFIKSKLPPKVEFKNRENKVPESSFSRAYSFASLGVNLVSSAVSSRIKGSVKGEEKGFKDYLITPENAEKISQTLCRVRGAPLKLGQALSIQEDNLIPKPIKEAFEKAQKSADVMPQSQLDSVLCEELGDQWENKFKNFDKAPIAAASIGQVHKGTLLDGTDVAIKIQYPGVAKSIDSDLDNLKRLFNYTNIFPKTMFMDDLIANARTELKEECDYEVEAQKQIKFKQIIEKHKGFKVPQVYTYLSTKKILVTEWISGLNLDQAAQDLKQDELDYLGALIFELTFRMLFHYRYMQTDPNPANYFYNQKDKQLNLIDFGAARTYSKEFVKLYMDVVYGASINDRKLVYDASKSLGFLTGEENREMVEAHVNSVIIVGEPFSYNKPFDFGNQNLTKRIYYYMPKMLKNRLKAPPSEIYSLHRMLSGAYLMNMKLRSRVNLAEMFAEIRKDFPKKLEQDNPI